MADAINSKGDDFWDRETLLAQRENELFAQEDELQKREDVLLEGEATLAVLNKAHVDREALLADREMTLRETEALLDARERVMNSAQSHASASELQALKIAALEEIQTQFDEREASQRAAEAALKERGAFVEASENTIFEKGQKLQELEAELAHLQDELSRANRAGRS
jgi:hypothetical protein